MAYSMGKKKKGKKKGKKCCSKKNCNCNKR